MAIHPIKIQLGKGAADCKLQLLEGCGTWGVFGDNNFLTVELDQPRVVVNVLEDHFPPQGGGVTEVRLTVPGAESITVVVSPCEVLMKLSAWQGDSATFTLFVNSGDQIFFDAWLSRMKGQGTVSVSSPDGDETDSLLPPNDKRRVTLPLMPPPRPCQ
ncbi:MAG TPA: hypothetical protein VMW75_06990 [Thermoanaerobaculia bacterium]|nr:hypothetical protein [Thermoanaerobaculia bacterium]